MEMTVARAQADMRLGYLSGSAGILASGLAWTAAAGVAMTLTPERAVWTLLIGGALIHPVGVVLNRLLGARGSHATDNPLGPLAAASTFWLIFCLPIAWALSLRNPAWFFPAMLLVIGGRYLVFATLYGMRLYWALGLTLAGAGFALAGLQASAALGAAAGAAIELVFAIVCLVQHRQWERAGGEATNAPSREAA